MEKGYFLSFILISTLIFSSLSLNSLSYQCPSSTGTLFTDQIKVSLNGDIVITNQDSYCYTITLPKNFNNKPNVAIALNKFNALPSKDLYLAIKPLPNNKTNLNPQSLTTLTFSVNLYQLYTKWTLVQFYFLAQDKPQVEAAYLMIDGSILSKCDTAKTHTVSLPFKNQLNGQIQAYTFLHGFQISSKAPSVNDKFSPLQVQILNKKVNSTGIIITLSVTSSTQVYSLLISYVTFQQNIGKVFGGSYVFQNYDQFPSESIRTVSHSPQVLIDQLWARINGLSGFIINSNSIQLNFDSGDFINVYNYKINNFWKYFSYQYVFFLGGLCSDCDGYPVYYLGQCIKQCPPQTNFNGYTCIQCSQTQVWNGTHCINRCNSGKVWMNYNCVCPDNTQWNGFACIFCTGGKAWNTTTRTCNCPLNTVWNGYSCVICDYGKIFDPLSKNCICPLGTSWNGLSCIQCNGGRIYNSISRQCQCPNGYWNGFSCVTSCMNGMSWDTNLKTCICPLRTYSYNGGCIACGSVNGDSLRSQCRCTNSNSYWNGYTCIVCDKNRIFDQFMGTCICPDNKQWNGVDCVNSVCPKGYDQIGKSCFCPLNTKQLNGQCIASNSCTNGMIWNNQNLKCEQIQCQPGTYWDGEKCYSTAIDQNGGCPYGTYWNGFVCASYTDTCPQGTQWTGDYCQTVQKKCQLGMYWTGSNCAVIPSQCPAQLIWNDIQRKCLSVNNVCPSGTYNNGGTCMPYSNCKNGQIWSNTLVQCICPDNSFWNGVSCIVCSGGMLYSPDGCYCPLGTFLNGNTCSQIQSQDCKAIPYSVLNGQVCDCIEGFDKIDGACVCKGVLTGPNQCDKCTLKPNSKWNGIVCQCNDGYIEVLGKCKSKSQTPNPTGVITQRPRNQCTVGTYFDTYQQKCLLCSDGCLSCRNCYDCQQCRPQYNYFAASKACVQICGDGKRFSLQCDDGNNDNGDGCSSDCKIEPQFTCNSGSPNSKDTCTKHKPTKLQLYQSGQTHLFGKIILNVRINYLPTSLTTNVKQCNQSCDRVLLVKLIEGQKTFLSINSKYIKGSSYSFSIEIDFGRQPISQFTAEVSFNDKIKDKFFSGIDISQTLKISVNPAYLALVASKKEDKLN